MKNFSAASADEKCPVVRRKNSDSIPFPLRRTAVLLFGLIFLSQIFCGAQETPTEYQIKAAFVYNFVKFVEWPPQSFTSTNSPIIIGLLGKNVFGDNVEQAIRNKVINNRELQFKVFQSVAEATNCNVLFVSASERRHYSEILKAFRDRSILTVSESDGSDDFIRDGGIINFVIVDKHVRFQINDANARSVGLKISSDLLSIAIPAG